MDVVRQSHGAGDAGDGVDFLRRNKANIIVLLSYFFIALVVFWPMTANIAGTVAGIGGDPYQSMWGLWWVPYSTFTLHHSFWTTDLLFWPVGANLIYQVMMPIGGLIVSPLQAVGPMFAYNVLFFLGIVLSGFGMFILSDYIVKNRYAAFIAGIIFTFSAFHIAQVYGHVEYSNIEWIPLAIYAFLRMLNMDYFEIRRTSYLAIAGIAVFIVLVAVLSVSAMGALEGALAAAATIAAAAYAVIRGDGRTITAFALAAFLILAAFMGDIEQGIMLVMALFLIGVAYAASKGHRSRVASRGFLYSVAAFVALALVMGAWALVPIAGGVSSSTVNQLSNVSHNMIWSDDLLSFFLPSYYNGIFNGGAQSYISIYHQDIGETTSYIGYSVLALAAYGIYKARRRTRLWLGVGVIFFLFALGPYVLVNNAVTVPGPYFIVRSLPVLNVMREPGRFDLMVSLAAAMLAAFGVKELFERFRKAGMTVAPGRPLLLGTAVITVIILIDTAMPPLSGSLAASITTTPHISQLYVYLGRQHANFTLLALPVIPDQYSMLPGLDPGKAMFTTVYTHRPIIGGYLTRENVSQEATLYNIPLAVGVSGIEAGLGPAYASVVNESYVNQTLLGLYLYNATVVTLDMSAFNSTTLPEAEQYIEGMLGAPQYNFANDSVVGWNVVNDIRNSYFKSYVAFPQILYWTASLQNVGNRSVTVWNPGGHGIMLVYAPYLQNQSSSQYTVNTVVTVDAVSFGAPSVLGVGRITGSGVSTIALLNISGGQKDYNFTTQLLPGKYGNGLVFAFSNQSLQNSAAGIISVRFSLGNN